MPDKSYVWRMAEELAMKAGERYGEDKQTEALGEGLSAIAYALLEVADAIREQTAAQQ